MARPKAGYKLKDGTLVPGVTTILGRWKDSGGLLQWAFRQGKEGKATLYEQRDEAGLIGTYSHELIEWHVWGESGNEPQPDPEMTNSAIARGRLAYDQFLRWERTSGYHVIAWEEPMVSERYRYGGTIDAVFEFEGELVIGDWKTSKGIYADALLQTCAYLLLYNEHNPETPITGGIDIVRFSKDAAISDHRQIRDEKLIAVAQRQFLRLREAYDDDKLIQSHF